MKIYFNYKKFCEYSAKRYDLQIKNKSNLLAAAFKKRRLQLNMTLEEVTKYICSKAYLCKFENNQLTIDEKVARVLCERVNLDYDLIQSIGLSNNLSAAMRYYLFNQYEQLAEISYKSEFDCFIPTNKILELLNCLLSGEFEKSEELIIEIDSVRSTLSDYEFITFGILICEFYIRSNQYIIARDFIKGFCFDTTVKELRFIYLEQCFNVYFNLGDVKEAYNAYHLLEKEFQNGFPRKREFLNKLHFCEMFSPATKIQEVKDMLDDMIPEEYIEEYWYSYAICLIRNNEFGECMRLIQKYELNNSKFVALYTYCANESVKNLGGTAKDGNPSKKLSAKVINYMNSSVEKMEKNRKNTIDRNFIKLMQLELVGTPTEELVAYIREVALKYDSTYQHRFYSYVYTHHLFEFLGTTTRYKEAFLIAKNNRTFK